MKRPSKYLELLYTVLEEGIPQEIPVPNFSAAKKLRTALYKTRSRLKSKSVTNPQTTPFDHFVIGIQELPNHSGLVTIDPTPPALAGDLDGITLRPATTIPTHGGSRQMKVPSSDS